MVELLNVTGKPDDAVALIPNVPDGWKVCALGVLNVIVWFDFGVGPHLADVRVHVPAFTVKRYVTPHDSEP